jgi:hypothetical protein
MQALKSVFGTAALFAAAAHAAWPPESPPQRTGTIISVPEGSVPGTTVADIVTPFSILVNDQTAIDGWTTHQVTGLVESRVVRADDGTYDFLWRIAPSSHIHSTRCRNLNDCYTYDETNPLDVAAFDVQSFIGGAAMPGYMSGPQTAGAPRTLAADGKGNFQFRFSDVQPYDPDYPSNVFWGNSALTTDNESLYFFLDTDARAYAKTATYTVYVHNVWKIWGYLGSSDKFSTFAPAAIPEPATGVLLLLGIAGIGAAVGGVGTLRPA